MPKFSATFVLHHENGAEKLGVVPPTEFSTKTTNRKEFWQKLWKLEKKLSREYYGGDVIHLIVTALENIPECGIEEGDIVAYKDLD